MRIMSCNLRYDNKNDGEYRWENRFPAMKEVWREYNPDIIGVQEGLPHQIEDIKETFNSLKYFGTGREINKEGEQVGIFFNKDKFNIIDKGNFWLSKTPKIVGSKDFNSDVPRLVNWIIFNNNNIDENFMFLNTHLDNKSKLAREKSSEIISNFVKEKSNIKNVIITGDLNTTPEAKPIIFLKDNLDLKDALLEIGENDATFHDFKGKGIVRIDYILCSNKIDVKEGAVIKKQYSGIYPSDHYLLYVDVSI